MVENVSPPVNFFEARFLTLLHEEVTLLQSRRPDLADAISRGNAVLLAGLVFPHDDGMSATVASRTEAEKSYEVNGECPCPAAHWNEKIPCAHVAAWRLYQYVSKKLLAEHTLATAEPAAAPVPTMTEAPVSVNCYLDIDGHKVQVTLRGGDERHVLARMKAVIAEYGTHTKEGA